MPSDALKGLQSKNFTTQIQSSCGTIPTEDIKRYYDNRLIQLCKNIIL